MMGKDKKKILIIEDDNEMRSLLKDFFKEEGYETDSVDQGTSAFKKLMTESFHLIITDIQMPGSIGLEMIQGLEKFQPDTPIIVITAFGGERVHLRTLGRGANAYLEKPVHLPQLRTLVHNMIHSNGKNVER